MDKADLAIAISLLAAAFSGWQGYSAHVSTKISKQQAKRKELAFEVSHYQSKDYSDWLECEIIARNLEPVSAKISGLRYRKRGVLLLPSDAQVAPSAEAWNPEKVAELPKEEADRRIGLQRTVGPAGQQASQSDYMPSQTEYVRFFATGPFDARHLDVEWEWADGQKR